MHHSKNVGTRIMYYKKGFYTSNTLFKLAAITFVNHVLIAVLLTVNIL